MDSGSAEADPLALGPTFKSASLSVVQSRGYELALDVRVHDARAVSGHDVPPECGDLARSVGGRTYVLNVVPIEVRATDRSPGGFSWPSDDPLYFALPGRMALGDPEWKTCTPASDGDQLSVELPSSGESVIYAAAVSEATPNNPRGDFSRYPALELNVSYMIVGGAETRGCPDAASGHCLLGPEVSRPD